MFQTEGSTASVVKIVCKTTLYFTKRNDGSGVDHYEMDRLCRSEVKFLG